MTQELERNNTQRWIPVAEQLPVKDTPVLIALAGDQGICISRLLTWETDEGTAEICFANPLWDDVPLELAEVTHWTPLPVPPE